MKPNLQGGISGPPPSRRIGVAVLVLAAGLWTCRPGFAQAPLDSDCHALKLKAATGVPQAKIHTYQFSGTCNINAMPPTGPKVEKTVPAVAEATWDGSKLEFTESFHVLAAVHFTDSIDMGRESPPGKLVRELHRGHHSREGREHLQVQRGPARVRQGRVPHDLPFQ